MALRAQARRRWLAGDDFTISYLNAAADISRMAVGDRQAARVDTVYTNPSYVSQHPWDHVEGAPYGTRGGLVVTGPTGTNVMDVTVLIANGGGRKRI